MFKSFIIKCSLKKMKNEKQKNKGMIQRCRRGKPVDFAGFGGKLVRWVQKIMLKGHHDMEDKTELRSGRTTERE